MHGTNPIRKLEAGSDGQRLQVHEIFFTMQGEGPFAGQRAVFVRMSGCHFTCSFCDTVWRDETDPYMTLAEIIGKVYELWQINNRVPGEPRPFVVLTGGEPMRQNVGPLIMTCHRLGIYVQIETAGSFWWHEAGLADIVVSPKTAHVHERIAGHAMAYKYIIRATDQLSERGLPIAAAWQAGSKRDVELWAPPLGTNPEFIWVSPCDECEDTAATTANVRCAVDLVYKYGYRLNLQLHKMVGVP